MKVAPLLLSFFALPLAFAQTGTDADIQRYENVVRRQGTAPPANIAEQQQRTFFQERFEKFRSGRLNNDQTPLARGTRYSDIMELHEDNKSTGSAAHAASDIEQVVDRYSKQNTTIRDSGGTMVTVNNENGDRKTRSFYNYVKPHGSVLARDRNGNPTETTEQVKARVEREGFDMVDRDHYRKLLKNGARRDLEEVGQKYGNRVVREATVCAYDPNAEGCGQRKMLPNRDFLAEEAEWLRKKIQIQTEDDYRELQAKRMNQGVQNISQLADGPNRPYERNLGVNQKSTLEASDPNNKYQVVTYQRRSLAPNFKVSEEDAPSTTSLLDSLDLKSALGNALSRRALRNLAIAETTNPRLTPLLDFELSDGRKLRDTIIGGRPDPYAILSDNNLDESTREQLEGLINQEIRGIANSGSVEFKNMATLLDGNTVCKNPGAICVYDPDTETVQPYERFYDIPGNDYGSIVQNLDELVSRDNFIAMTNPLALENQAVMRGNNADFLTARELASSQNEQQMRAELVANVRQDMARVTNTLRRQRRRTIEKLQTLDMDTNQVAPVPSQDEIMASVLTGRQLSLFGGDLGKLGSIDPNAWNNLNALGDQDYEKIDNWNNINPNDPRGKKYQGLADTVSGGRFDPLTQDRTPRKNNRAGPRRKSPASVGGGISPSSL